MSTIRVLLEIAAVLGLVHSIRLVVQSWAELPERIPIHFGFTGQPDNWGKKAWIWLYPVMCVGLYALLTHVSTRPETFNYPVPITPENKAKQYELALLLMSTLKAEMVWLLAYIELKTIRIAHEKENGLGAAFLPVFLVILLATTGLFIHLAYLAR